MNLPKVNFHIFQYFNHFMPLKFVKNIKSGYTDEKKFKITEIFKEN